MNIAVKVLGNREMISILVIVQITNCTMKLS